MRDYKSTWDSSQSYKQTVSLSLIGNSYKCSTLLFKGKTSSFREIWVSFKSFDLWWKIFWKHSFVAIKLPFTWNLHEIARLFTLGAWKILLNTIKQSRLHSKITLPRSYADCMFDLYAFTVSNASLFRNSDCSVIKPASLLENYCASLGCITPLH